MDREFIVHEPFGKYPKGKVLTDEAEIAEAMKTNPHHMHLRANLRKPKAE